MTREYGKMGKSLKNSVTPDEMYDAYGADTLRLYEMFTGPFDQSRPWNTRDVIGVHRLLQRIWRNAVDEETGALTVTDDAVDAETMRELHRMIAAAHEGYGSLRFNTVVARITEFNNHLIATFDGGVPRAAIEPLVLVLAPLAPHIAEELWQRLGHDESLAWAEFPDADESLLVAETVEIPVQINGKVRSHLTVAADASPDDLEAAARADDRISESPTGAVAPG